MGHALPRKLKRKFVPYYPAQLMMEDGAIISTGPYSKARCGDTQKEITEYIVHLTEDYKQRKFAEKELIEKFKEKSNNEIQE